MKLIKKMRKGFTLIELVVVIAVIAILSAVAVVSYLSITNKAKQSNDQQKVDQVNLSLAAAEISGKPKTMAEALESIEADGFSVDKFKAEAKDYEFAYVMEENRIVLLNKGTSVVYPKDFKQGQSPNVWRFAANNDAVKADGFSYYLLDDCAGEIATEAAGGLDVGKNQDITLLKYKSSAEQKVVINAGGDQCVVEIDGAQSDVMFYGFAKKLDVKAVKGSSLHIFGSIGNLQLEQGHAVVESTGIVFDVIQIGGASTGTGATLTNNGFVAQASLSSNEDSVKEAAAGNMSGTAASSTLEIGSLSQLESFRDAVNAQNDFAGLTVKLTKDIALNDGWKPIGEGARKVYAANTEATKVTTFFAGTFDGQNHTISNLNNKGFIPTQARLVKDDFKFDGVNETKVDTYAYGLFALTKGATFKNVKLTNVDIDEARVSDAYMDSVGGLVGYAQEGLTVENVSVSGSVKGLDAVCGIVGRINATTYDYVIKGCNNSANVTLDLAGRPGAGIVRFYSATAGSLTLQDNTNTGTIGGSSSYVAGIAIVSSYKSTNYSFTGNMSHGQAADEVTGADYLGLAKAA